jgi:hypothetical protein
MLGVSHISHRARITVTVLLYSYTHLTPLHISTPVDVNFPPPYLATNTLHCVVQLQANRWRCIHGSTQLLYADFEYLLP